MPARENLPQRPTDSPASAKPRMLWMDLLRGVGLFLVMLLHSTTILDRFDIERAEWIRHLNDSVAPFRIPLLMFLSGLLLSAALKKSPEAYFTGKIRNIAYPYVLWTLIYAAIIGIPHAVYNPKFWAGPTYLWYLFFLLLYYVCAFVLRDIRPLIICAVALAASVLAPDDSKYGERLLYLMSFFFLGHAVSTSPSWARVLENKWLLALSPLLVIFGAMSAYYGPYRYGAEYAPFTIAGIVVLCVFARAVAHTRLAAPFVYIGQNGIVFYVTHYLVIYLTMSALAYFGIRSWGVMSGGSLAMALTVGFLLSFLAASFWFVRLLFIGPEIPFWPVPRRSNPSLPE